MDLPTLIAHSVTPLSSNPDYDVVSVEGVAGESIVPAGSIKAGEDVLYIPSGYTFDNKLYSLLGLDFPWYRPEIHTFEYDGQISIGLPVSLARIDRVRPLLSSFEPHQRANQLFVERVGTQEDEPAYSTRNPEAPEELTVGFYDVADAALHLDVISDLLNEPVVVTEKLNGWHYSATIRRNGGITVANDAFDIPHDESDHLFWRVLFDERIDFILSEMLRMSPAEIDVITLRGEYIGPDVRRNPYFLAVPEVRFFEVEIDGEPVDTYEALALFDTFAMKHVPILSRPGQTFADWLNRRAILDASNGKSRLANTLREGIVVRPVREASHPSIGRVILAVHSPEYAIK